MATYTNNNSREKTRNYSYLLSARPNIVVLWGIQSTLFLISKMNTIKSYAVILNDFIDEKADSLNSWIKMAG